MTYDLLFEVVCTKKVTLAMTKFTFDNICSQPDIVHKVCRRRYVYGIMWPRSADGSASDCRVRGPEFDIRKATYFRFLYR